MPATEIATSNNVRRTKEFLPLCLTNIIPPLGETEGDGGVHPLKNRLFLLLLLAGVRDLPSYSTLVNTCSI